MVHLESFFTRQDFTRNITCRQARGIFELAFVIVFWRNIQSPEDQQATLRLLVAGFLFLFFPVRTHSTLT